jgi:hypothetical protein
MRATAEVIRLPPARNVALTCRRTGLGVDSVKAKRRVKVPSLATASPRVPSSTIVPRVARILPLESTRSSLTLPGTTGLLEGAVIWLVTVTRVVWLTTRVDGWATGVPTVGVDGVWAGETC